MTINKFEENATDQARHHKTMAINFLSLNCMIWILKINKFEEKMKKNVFGKNKQPTAC